MAASRFARSWTFHRVAEPDRLLEEMVRIEGGRVLATLIRLTGDFDLAEDAVQDAAVVAFAQWQRTGVPDNPAAWMTTVARRKALDRIRREMSRRDRETAAVRLLDDPPSVAESRPDELRLLFTCCHPSLSRDAQVALTLRTLCGLTTTEISRAFLVAETTMGQRISRAKKKIATAHISYRVPDDHELPERLPSVLSTIYLVFTTGHHAPSGALASRVDLAHDALRLARLAANLLPDEPEAVGLLALILATHARRNARTDSLGNIVLMADQDRSRWDHEAIAESSTLVDQSLRRWRAGPFQIQAAIATLHGLAPTFEATDWTQIAQLYEFLEARQPTSVIRINRAVAVSFAEGPERGLAVIDSLTDSQRNEVDGWHLYWSTRADFLRQLGRSTDAASAYRRALACPTNDSDRRFLEGRLLEVEAAITTPSSPHASRVV